MKRLKTYDIKIKDSLFDPDGKNSSKQLIAHYRKDASRSDKTHYKVFLYIEGKDVPFIKKVKYTLHKTFRNPVKIIERKPDNPHCSLILWTWGVFTVNIELEDMSGEKIYMQHYMNYGNEIKTTKNINWQSKAI